jgi:hypothetical protein
MKLTGLRNLCTPSHVYLVISMIALFIMGVQNFGNMNTYCVGSLTCSVGSTTLVFAIKILYILFWTWILNLICKAGVPQLAWFLVLLPFILFFILIALMFSAN